MKILYVTTISNTINAFLIPHIRMLIEEGHKVELACNVVQEVNAELINLGCKVHIVKFTRSPLKKQNYIAYKELKNLVQIGNYDLVHTHTPIASACVRIACKNIECTRVIYTAHGFHFFKGAPLKNWLIFYPIEKYLAKYTDILITINKEDFIRAKKSFKANEIVYIPGIGLDTQLFKLEDVDKASQRRELGIPKDAFILLSVGELNKNKNQETVIRALSILNNPEIYYVICGEGPLEVYLKNLIQDLNLQNSVKILGYRTDIANICNSVDAFVFPSKREGLGLAALEAMASGLPIITSNVHGINDYSIEGITGFKSHSTDAGKFAEMIKKLSFNKELQLKMSSHNLLAVKDYDIKKVIISMKKLYNNL